MTKHVIIAGGQKNIEKRWEKMYPSIRRAIKGLSEKEEGRCLRCVRDEGLFVELEIYKTDNYWVFGFFDYLSIAKLESCITPILNEIKLLLSMESDLVPETKLLDEEKEKVYSLLKMKEEELEEGRILVFVSEILYAV